MPTQINVAIDSAMDAGCLDTKQEKPLADDVGSYWRVKSINHSIGFYF